MLSVSQRRISYKALEQQLDWAERWALDWTLSTYLHGGLPSLGHLWIERIRVMESNGSNRRWTCSLLDTTTGRSLGNRKRHDGSDVGVRVYRKKMSTVGTLANGGAVDLFSCSVAEDLSLKIFGVDVPSYILVSQDRVDACAVFRLGVWSLESFGCSCSREVLSQFRLWTQPRHIFEKTQIFFLTRFWILTAYHNIYLYFWDSR